MKTALNKQILILMLAVSVLCLSIVIAIVGTRAPKKDEEKTAKNIDVSAINAQEQGAKALLDARITLEQSNVTKVGDLESDQDDSSIEDVVEFITSTTDDVTEEDKPKNDDPATVVEFITAVADDGEEYEVIDFGDDEYDVFAESGNEMQESVANLCMLGVNGADFDINHIDWDRAIMANVKDYCNVRVEPDANSARAGKMEVNDVGVVLSVTDEWVHMVSGDLEGYIKKSLCFLGDEAKERAEEVCDTVAVSNTKGLRVRKGPSQNDGIIRNVEKGTKLTVAKPEKVDVDYDEDEWVPIRSGNGIGFVAKEYVTISWDIGVGMTVEEEEAIQREKEEAARKGKASTNTDDLILLAALIEGEGNGQPYEGKVAIANVVLNRVNSGGYPNSIYNVIYQAGQFGPALSGKVAQIVLKGPTSANKDAAAAALGGLNYIGGCTHFKPISSGMAGAVIGSHVFY